MGEIVLRNMMVLNKIVMVLIHSSNGSLGVTLVVILHLDVSRGRFFRLEYFLLLFPPNQPIWMTLYISQQLVKHGEKGTTKGEIIKWFGVIILATRL